LALRLTGYATIRVMKKQMVVALVLVLLIPVVMLLGGLVSNHINPEAAAGHANYGRNFHILSMVKNLVLLAAAALAGLLWLAACFLVIRSKDRSWWWLALAVLGPCGFAILATLNDRGETDRYTRFVRKLNVWVRIGYEVSCFVVIWWLAFQGMAVLRYLIIWRESVTSGMSTAQVVDMQNASSGMWAFGEGLEVMYMVALFYLLRPTVFNIASRATESLALRKAR